MPLPHHALTPLLLIVLTSCSIPKFARDPVQPAIASQLSPAVPSKPKTQTLKLKLTLDSPADLLVAEGDRVTKGQVISDRGSARLLLEAQRQVLRLKLQGLEVKAKPKFQDPVIEPEPLYGVELAKIEAARAEVRRVESQIRDFEQGSGYTEVAWQQLPMQVQRRELGVLDQKLDQARVEVDLAIARLHEAKDGYRRRVELARAKAKISVREAVNPVEKLQVVEELKILEEKISSVGIVKVPQTGVVKKVRWLGMQDQALQAEVSLAIEEPKHERLARLWMRRS